MGGEAHHAPSCRRVCNLLRHSLSHRILELFEGSSSPSLPLGRGVTSETMLSLARLAAPALRQLGGAAAVVPARSLAAGAPAQPKDESEDEEM